MSKKLDYIDAIRGLAILGVMIVHTSQYGTNIYPEPISYLLNHGATGVQLFFVASAFTLFLSYESRRTREYNPKLNFFIRRFFRIAPMYYLGILYFSWQTPANTSPAAVILNLLFIHSFSPEYINLLVPGGWSISVEIMFYTLVPFLFAQINSTNRAIKTFIIAFVIYLTLKVVTGRFLPPTFENKEFFFMYLPSQMPIFLCGIIAYFLIIKNDYSINSKVLFALAVIMVSHAIWTLLPNHFIISVGFTILLVSLAKFQTKLLINPFFTYLGKISFSGYLVHFAVLHWLNHFGLIDFISTNNTLYSILNFSIRLIVVVGISTAIATLFYHLIEVPMQNIGRNFINRLESNVTSGAKVVSIAEEEGLEQKEERV